MWEMWVLPAVWQYRMSCFSAFADIYETFNCLYTSLRLRDGYTPFPTKEKNEEDKNCLFSEKETECVGKGESGVV